MSDNKSKFIRKYSRASKSPWNDTSTILLYANSEILKDGSIELSYQNYIYLHRDILGMNLGISFSKVMLEANPDFQSKYLEGIEMLGFLLMHIEEICDFCLLFSNEFESIFLIDPVSFFEAADQRWLKILEQF